MTDLRRSIHFFYVLIACVLTLNYGSHTQAAEFHMITTMDVGEEDGLPVIHALTVNKGPSVAYDLVVSVECFGRAIETLPRPELDVNELNRVDFSLNPENNKKGEYAAVLRINFRDRDGIPVSQCQIHPVRMGESPHPDIQVEGTRYSLGVTGQMDFHILNMGTEKRKIEVRLIHPLSLFVPEARKEVWLEPGQKKRIRYDMMNRYANPGDAFQVYCSAEYETGGAHVISIGKSDLVINRDEAFTGRLRMFLWVMFSATLGLWIGYLMMARKRRGHVKRHDEG